VSLELLLNTLLFEGYALYPYRDSAVKNRMRFTFGTLFPKTYAAASGEAFDLELQVPVVGPLAARLSLELAFLEVSNEVIERRLSLANASLAELREERTESIHSGVLSGLATVRVLAAASGASVLSLRVENRSELDALQRETALSHAFAAAHVIVRACGAELVSLVDPAPGLAEVARGCLNRGVFPVLVGEPGARDCMIASPITMGDYPGLAPESPGELFDATEIDEILTLRVLTLSDDEQNELARADPRVRAMLDRVQSMTPADLALLHGAERSRQVARVSGDALIAAGARVRLLPRKRADAFDMLLEGKTARVESIERDFENRTLLAVTIEDDPGRDLGRAGMPAHRFFFHPDEVEVVS
jgi:hypothetical protein